LRPAAVPAQVVKVQPEPVIVGTPVTEPPLESEPEKSPPVNRMNPLNWFRSSTPEKNNQEAPAPVPIPAPIPAPVSHVSHVGVTPLPPANSGSATAGRPPAVPAKPVKIVQPASPTFPRYLYLSPRRPADGDRRTASNAFTRAREFEQNSDLPGALQAYRQAAELDPGWFEAQYNYGVIAYRLRNYQQSLAAYEMALAIQPESGNARYYFALTLKAAGYVTDAVNELEKILAAHPGEVRAHLALGNLYAQQLYDSTRARQHYLKVLQLDPASPQAPDIQFWLSSNPP
jgi:hypothetical protein